MIDTIQRAFTTRIPLAVLITMGIKEWENRSHLPTPAKGVCGMSCSRGSDEREYANFLAWVKRFSAPSLYASLPPWNQVKDWRGKMIAVMDYEATEEAGLPIWNEGYRYWWKLSNVKMLDEPFPVRGNVGLWEVIRND